MKRFILITSFFLLLFTGKAQNNIVRGGVLVLGGVGTYSLGYERIFSEKYGAEVTYNEIFGGGDNFSRIRTFHAGFKYYYKNEETALANNIYTGIFFRYEDIGKTVDQSEISHYTTQGYGGGIGVGKLFQVFKWIVVDAGALVYYSDRGIKEKFYDTRRWSLNSGIKALPRLHVGVNF